jgi:hypothetical protein
MLALLGSVAIERLGSGTADVRPRERASSCASFATYRSTTDKTNDTATPMAQVSNDGIIMFGCPSVESVRESTEQARCRSDYAVFHNAFLRQCFAQLAERKATC